MGVPAKAHVRIRAGAACVHRRSGVAPAGVRRQGAARLHAGRLRVATSSEALEGRLLHVASFREEEPPTAPRVGRIPTAIAMTPTGPEPAPTVAVRCGTSGVAGSLIAALRRRVLEVTQASFVPRPSRPTEPPAFHGGAAAPARVGLQTATALIPVRPSVGQSGAPTTGTGASVAGAICPV